MTADFRFEFGKNWQRFLELLGFPICAEFPSCEPPGSFGTRWLSCIIVDPDEFGTDREAVRLALESEDIESRPLWKPMYLRPLFNNARVRSGSASQNLFKAQIVSAERSSLTLHDLERIVELVRAVVDNDFVRRRRRFPHHRPTAERPGRRRECGRRPDSSSCAARAPFISANGDRWRVANGRSVGDVTAGAPHVELNDMIHTAG